MVSSSTTTSGGASLKKAISLYSPLIDYSAPLLQQTPETNSSSINQITLQQQQQLLTQVRQHRSVGVNLSQQTTPPPAKTTSVQLQPSSSTLTTITNGNHNINHNHHLQHAQSQNNNNNNNNNNHSGNSANLNECSNNFMNSVVHELNAIKLISNSSTSGVVGQSHHPTNTALNINCRSANVADHSLLFGMPNGGVGVGVGDSNNSISILSNSSCNKAHNSNNLWGQLPSANNNMNTNPTQLLYNQASATNISNLWGCTSASSSSAVTSNNHNQMNGNNNNNNNSTSSHPSLSPISSSSVRSSQYHSASSHRSNSKESLWTSSQSSPNSNLRESFYSIKSNTSPTSSNTSSAGSTCSSNGVGVSGGGLGGTGAGGGVGGGNGINLLSQSTSLWESPLVASSKQTMDAATSYASQLNKISNIWEIPNPTANVANICNSKPQLLQHTQQQQQQPQQQQRNGGNCLNTSFMGKSRDLLFNDLWSNPEGCSTTLNSSSDHHQHQQQHNQYAVGVASDNKLQSDTIGSIWRTTSTSSIAGSVGAHQQQQQQQSMANRNKATTNLQTKQQHRPVIGANASFFTNATDPSTASSHSSSAAAAAAATSGGSTCMQLFSEEFLNYLNMIN